MWTAYPRVKEKIEDIKGYLWVHSYIKHNGAQYWDDDLYVKDGKLYKIQYTSGKYKTITIQIKDAVYIEREMNLKERARYLREKVDLKNPSVQLNIDGLRQTKFSTEGAVHDLDNSWYETELFALLLEAEEAKVVIEAIAPAPYQPRGADGDDMAILFFNKAGTYCWFHISRRAVEYIRDEIKELDPKLIV